MKRVAVVVILVMAAAVLGLWRSQGGVREGLSRAVGASGNNSPSEARDEFRKSFELQPGARVEVQGINGKLTIITSDTTTAEVHVVRTAKNNDSLGRREVIVEQTSTGLLVKGKQARHAGLWEHLFGKDPNEEVTIRAPRQIALVLKGINGRVTSGDIDGPLEAKGINGRAELGQASESAEIGGINGNVSVTLNKLGNQGVRVSGVNGGIELRLGSALNADLTAKGMNGSIRSEIPDVVIDKDEFGSRYSARIGSGGSPITISGVNGNVRLTRAYEAPLASDKKSGEVKEEKASQSKAK
jgi:hypothetical protein